VTRREAAPNLSALRALLLAVHPAEPEADPLLSPDIAAEAVSLAVDHRLSVLLASRLQDLGQIDDLPEQARRALRDRLLARQSDHHELEQALIPTAAALESAGIPYIVLKGSALGALLYREPLHREMSDVDILVQPEQFAAARSALESAGFTFPSDDDIAFWKEAYYNLPITPPHGNRAIVEIHWSIAQQGRHHPDITGLFARARPCRFAGIESLAFSPLDQFLHQALHLSYHYYQPRLAWVLDLALLLSREDLPAPELFERAERWGMRIPLLLSFAYVERIFPGCLPADHQRLLHRSRHARWLLKGFGSKKPEELLAGWDKRRRQLLLAVLMLDGLPQMSRALGSWIKRRLRYEDREGHRRIAKSK